MQYLPDSNSEIIPTVYYWACGGNFSFPCKLTLIRHTLLMCYFGESGDLGLGVILKIASTILIQHDNGDMGSLGDLLQVTG